MRSAARIITAVLSAIVLTFPLAAQSTAEPEHHLTFNVGGGVTPTLGKFSDRLNLGWNFVAGAGWNFTPHFTVDGEFQYNGLGLDSRVLREFNVPDGNAHVWSLTANPMWRIHPEGPLGAYLIGGAGFYRRLVEFTRPTVAQQLVVDPFFGFIFPVLVPADVSLGSFGSNAFGLNAGGGITYNIGSSGTKVYVESRYHWADTRGPNVQMFPVTFGVRW